ncbi:hypothetical protein [Streptomyces sp. NBC_01465]|uniref:hypothetical protein n=1 Tax=Streptomyces sp. NBC_01465 TaxID=2903878 RepID=UPI002E3524D5|nr:hypothetical protein [Streptomyces sp. NBC_01465]
MTRFALPAALVAGVALTQCAARDRRLKAVAVTDEGYLDRIGAIDRIAQHTTSADAVVEHVRDELTGLVALDGCRFEYGRWR